MRIALLIAAATLTLTTHAVAEERYTIVEQGERVVRVDRQTGAVDYCSRTGTALTCQLAPQERAAWQSETEALSKRIETLETRLAALEGNPTAKPADEAEIDRALGLAERFITGFFGIVQRLQGNEGASGTN